MSFIRLVALLCFTAAPLAAQPSAPAAAPAPRAPLASYAGKWRLDVAQSRDLPFFYASVREHTLDIAQDDSTIAVDVVMTDTAGTAQRFRFPYDLRKPVRTTSQVRTPRGPIDIPTTLTATARTDGGVDVDIAREMTMGEQVLRPMDRETWHLSADGARLMIDRTAEMPGPGGMRAFTAHYVFVRR